MGPSGAPEARADSEAVEYREWWSRPGWARRYCRDFILRQQEGEVRGYHAAVLAASIQGIAYLCERPVSVLDIGCGPAIRSSQIRGYFGCDVLAMDYSPAMLDEATNLQSAMRPEHRVTLMQGNANALPFEANSFDVVYSSGTFMSIGEPAAAAAEALRVSRAGVVQIELCREAMSDDKRTSFKDTVTKHVRNRIWAHDYLSLWTRAGAKQIIYAPLPGSFDGVTIAGYARFIVCKEMA